jgi:hypothetical protein
MLNGAQGKGYSGKKKNYAHASGRENFELSFLIAESLYDVKILM